MKTNLYIGDIETLRKVAQKVILTGVMDVTLKLNPALLMDDEAWKILEDLAEFHPETQKRIQEKNNGA